MNYFNQKKSIRKINKELKIYNKRGIFYLKNESKELRNLIVSNYSISLLNSISWGLLISGSSGLANFFLNWNLNYVLCGIVTGLSKYFINYKRSYNFIKTKRQEFIENNKFVLEDLEQLI